MSTGIPSMDEMSMDQIFRSVHDSKCMADWQRHLTSPWVDIENYLYLRIFTPELTNGIDVPVSINIRKRQLVTKSLVTMKGSELYIRLFRLYFTLAHYSYRRYQIQVTDKAKTVLFDGFQRSLMSTNLYLTKESPDLINVQLFRCINSKHWQI